MVVLGVSAFGKNPAACLVVDGTLRGFCQEERFSRMKVSAGHFPTHAVGWCLRSRGLRLGDVDRIAVSWDCTRYPWHMLRRLAGVKLRLAGARSAPAIAGSHRTEQASAWIYLLSHTPRVFEQKIKDHLRDAGHRGPVPPVTFVPHHEAHALAAFHQSPFTESAVLVADGSGEDKTVSAYHASAGAWRRCFSIDVPQSLGWFYGAFTAYLGFHADRDEGKLMGLAALGAGRRAGNRWLTDLDPVLRVQSDGFELDPTFLKFGGHEHHPRFTDRLREFLVKRDPRLEPVGVGEEVDDGEGPRARYLRDEYVDLAFAVQDRLERALLGLARRLRRESGSSRLCLAGGVAMNCKANGRLLDESGFQEIFVHPAASDDGAAIGAAFHAARSAGELRPNPLVHAQLGPAYSTAQIEKALRVSGVAADLREDISADVASILAEGKTCGWFQGGLEMGARALGGRSIVACPWPPHIKNRLNREVKFREPWRPYCPSMTGETRATYIEGERDTPFMIVARPSTTALRERGAATVHVDGSVRPQTVRADTLPLWHRLLAEVGRRTGDPVVLNTSFNVRGEPIVCMPHDAIRCFHGTGLDALAIGDFLVRKAR